MEKENERKFLKAGGESVFQVLSSRGSGFEAEKKNPRSLQFDITMTVI